MVMAENKEGGRDFAQTSTLPLNSPKPLLTIQQRQEENRENVTDEGK